jgi:hypothetical protein
MWDWSMRAALAAVIGIGVLVLPGKQPPPSAAPVAETFRSL